MNEPKQHRPVEILQQLIRFDTTNPPGNERACIEFIEQLLTTAGIQTETIAQSEQRPNLIARLPGSGHAPPLLLYGHADVVPTAHQTWTHPPFAGQLIEGYVWGRGALDMKGGLAMMITALLRAATRQIIPAGDVVLAVVADEEAGGSHGARFLVEQHPRLFEGVRYAIGEFGGFPLRIAGQTFYLIQVGEKAPCWLEATVKGPAGHGARPMRDGAMAALGRLLSRLNHLRLPIHITPIVREMIESVAVSLPLPKRAILRRLLNPLWTDRILTLLGETGRNLEPLFRNTVNATIVQGGERPNVIPSEIVVGLDARLLPGATPDDLLHELRPHVGTDLDIVVQYHDVSTADPDFGLLDLLRGLLHQADPNATAIPYLLPGSSDSRHFSRLGIQTYGFTPMNLCEEFHFFQTIHAANERIPATAVAFGADVLFSLIEQYGASATDTDSAMRRSSATARYPHR